MLHKVVKKPRGAGVSGVVIGKVAAMVVVMVITTMIMVVMVMTVMVVVPLVPLVASLALVIVIESVLTRCFAPIVEYARQHPHHLVVWDH